MFSYFTTLHNKTHNESKINEPYHFPVKGLDSLGVIELVKNLDAINTIEKTINN